MTTFRNANEVKEQVVSRMEALRKKQKQEAFACLGNNKAKLFEIIEGYIRHRRFFIFYWMPVVRFPSYQYRQSGDKGLWALEWETENLTFQFVYEDGWNTIDVFDHCQNLNEDNLVKLKVKLERAFPFYTIRIHNGYNQI